MTFEFGIATVFALFAGGAGAMLTLILLGARKSRTGWLAAFVGVFTYGLLAGLLARLEAGPKLEFVLGVLPSLNFLALPFLYFYASFAVGERIRSKILHCVPAIVALIALAVFPDLNRLHLYWLLALQSFLYLLVMLRRVNQYRRRIRQQYSSLLHIDLNWLQTVLIALLALGIFDLFIFPLARQVWITPSEAQAAFNLLGTLYLLWMAGGAISQEFVQVDPQIDSKPAPYEKSGLDDHSARALAAEIHKAMQDQQLYLEPDLTLGRLAEAAGTSTHITSEVLNKTIGQSFYDFVNQQRIETAKSHLAEGSSSVLEIAFLSGFNNKVSFNKAFRRFEATTPSEYRRMQQRRTG